MIAASAPAAEQTIAGRWDGTITIEKLKVPLRMQISIEGTALRGAFVNGPESVMSTKGSFADGRLRLEFASGAVLEARLQDTMLKGTYRGHAWEASPYCSCAYEGEAGPEVNGDWVLDGGVVVTLRRHGEDTLATLRRGGDSIGPITGRFDGLQFALHFFDGTRAVVLEMEPKKDGTMAVTLEEPGSAARKLTARKQQASGN